MLLLLVPSSLWAEQWKTWFAYNNVSQIAMSPNTVYAMSDGSLYSVDKQTEQLKVYSRLSGLHSTGITCIYFDNTSGQLIIGYGTGKIDLLTDKNVKYVGELYDKNMTQRKTINNITVSGHTAYLSTAFGVQTLDLRTNRLVDSYWLRPGGVETDVQDVVVSGDSIYAFTSDSMFAASLATNIVDYTYWKREIRSGRVSPDPDKRVHYKDLLDNWYAGHESGILRVSPLGEKTYKPQGPLNNNPYRIRSIGKKVGIVQGGYAVPFFYRSGMVMLLEDGQWHNYDPYYMADKLGFSSLDYCDIIFDPSDPSHFFVASFGYGLIEFRGNEFFHQYNASNSALEAVDGSGNYPYIWVDGLQFDAEGNLWMLNNSANGIKVLMKDGSWVSLSNAACFNIDRSQDLLISNQNPNIKILSSLMDGGIGVMDDRGTITDQSDDRAVICRSFTDETGNVLFLPRIKTLCQTPDGALLIGTLDGLFRIADPVALLDGNMRCEAIHISHPAEDIPDIFSGMQVPSIIVDHSSRVWLGTDLSGVYCLSADLSSVTKHFSIDNSPMPSNNVLSLHMEQETETLYIGTGEGLVAYNENASEGLQEADLADKQEENNHSYGSMRNWKTHFAYNNISSIEDAGNTLYCLSSGALLAIDKESEEVHPQSKLTGLNGSEVVQMCYNAATRKTLIIYRNGYMDIIYHDGSITAMPDVLLTSTRTPGEFYSTYSYNDHIYICSSYGIMCANMRRNEIAETYVIQDDNKDVETQYVCVIADSIYSASKAKIYAAALGSNLVDGTIWKALPDTFTGTITGMTEGSGSIYIHMDSTLYRYSEGQRSVLQPEQKWRQLYRHTGSPLARSDEGIYRLAGSECDKLDMVYTPNDILRDGNSYWIALPEESIIRWNTNQEVQAFSTNSPFENLSYRIRIEGDKLIMLPGGYMVGSYNRLGTVMIYENGEWMNYTHSRIYRETGGFTNFYDFCDAAVDPKDPSHFFVSSFGYGLLEFRDNNLSWTYLPYNTTNGLESMNAVHELGFTWVDGLQFDADGNLWMLNNSANGVKVFMKDGTWVRYDNAATHNRDRTKDLLIWNRDPNIKIITCLTGTPGIGVIDDRGTITYTGDDNAVFFSSFIDQNEKPITPQSVYSICQMANGEIWVGTESGLFIIPDVRKLLAYDNHCRRVIIPRNDGTGLGDYLLGDEVINCITEDAGGRKWIGTANSGLYLVSDDGLITHEHFTMYNSPLISNEIHSLAIHQRSGEVFIGTSMGLLSYQSDANEAQPDMSHAYAYPNPVYSGYEGYISITGLMDNTVVNIVDAGGNLVCKTRSNGGLAIWDGRLPDGRKATPGVYSALCNAEGGHTVCKILLLR